MSWERFLETCLVKASVKRNVVSTIFAGPPSKVQFKKECYANPVLISAFQAMYSSVKANKGKRKS